MLAEQVLGIPVAKPQSKDKKQPSQPDQDGTKYQANTKAQSPA